jgi:hypothetical protein
VPGARARSVSVSAEMKAKKQRRKKSAPDSAGGGGVRDDRAQLGRQRALLRLRAAGARVGRGA